jgi:hypothetical protein
MTAAAPTPAGPDEPPDARDGWLSLYGFEWSGGEWPPGSGTTPVVEYAIQLRRVREVYRVEICSNGYQTMGRMRGEGRVLGSSLDVTFDACGTDDLYRCSRYKRGERLFSLVRRSDGVWLHFEGMGAPDLRTKELRACDNCLIPGTAIDRCGFGSASSAKTVDAGTSHAR